MLRQETLSDNFPKDFITPYNSIFHTNCKTATLAVIRAGLTSDFPLVNDALKPKPGTLVSRKIFLFRENTNSRFYPGEIQYLFRVKKLKRK